MSIGGNMETRRVFTEDEISAMELVFDDIAEERAYQLAKWGGQEHDDSHSIRDWITYLLAYLGRAGSRETDWGRNIPKVRELFIKVAALAVAAVEAIDRRTHESTKSSD